MPHLLSAVVFLELFFVPLLYGVSEHCGDGFGRSQASKWSLSSSHVKFYSMLPLFPTWNWGFMNHFHLCEGFYMVAVLLSGL